MIAKSVKNNQRVQAGFTLIELVVSMVLTALALAALTNFFFTQTSRTIEPLFQMRAAKLGEAVMDEIFSRPYDEQTPVGGVPACDISTCTALADLGAAADGESAREEFDDVDDYDAYCNDSSPFDIVDVLGATAADTGNALEDFQAFKMSICVIYDGDYDGVEETNEINAKRVTVKIFPPGVTGIANAISFVAYRGNF